MTVWVPTTSAACATVLELMQTWMESVMMWTIVSGLWMHAAFATALVLFTNAVVKTSLKALATATATSLTSVAFAMVQEWMQIWMAFAMTSMIVLEPMTNVAFATVQVPFMSVDARAFQWASVTATVMCWTIVAYAVVMEPAAFAQSTQWAATPRLLVMSFALSKEENSKCSMERATRPKDRGS